MTQAERIDEWLFAGMPPWFNEVNEKLLAAGTRLLRQDGGRLRRVDPDAKSLRRATKLMKECAHRWQKGRTVKEAQVLLLQPLVWRELEGIGLRSGAPVSGPLALLDPSYEQHDKVVDMGASLLVARHAGLLTYDDGVRRSAIEWVQNRLWGLWSYMRSVEMSRKPCVFSSDVALLHELIASDIAPSLESEAVRPPFPAFYIRLPPELGLELYNRETGYHRASILSVAEAVRGGDHDDIQRRGLLCEIVCEPNESSTRWDDDHTHTFMVPLGPDSVPIAETLQRYDRHWDDKMGTYMKGARYKGEEFDYVGERAILRSLVLNYVLFLNTPGAVVRSKGATQPEWPPRPPMQTKPSRRTRVKVKKRKRRPRANAHALAEGTYVYEVSHQDAPEAVFSTDVLVRGHFYNQAHGPRLSLRRLRWRRPHVRRPSLVGASEGHDYEVARS